MREEGEGGGGVLIEVPLLGSLLDKDSSVPMLISYLIVEASCICLTFYIMDQMTPMSNGSVCLICRGCMSSPYQTSFSIFSWGWGVMDHVGTMPSSITCQSSRFMSAGASIIVVSF